ncbi:MAG: tRNA uridine(34) 5-carboxymethylaminomethyl modification radical SAM/GNAT enzyme Elp3 [Thermoplasmata archaeon]|nr:MAG: tRNA uridine(34) 5-carboxymethylaminomethyl modification radical SAM/GNAT enzyme Elp3 [Thermoplasmata archaeon]
MGIREELARAVAEGRVADREELERLKRQLAARDRLPRVPTDADILAAMGDDVPEESRALLRTKPSRSLSGVTVVAVMTPPSSCPHGRCAYCPGGVEEGTPQSYTGKEPAARRGERADYDGGAQTADRLGQLRGAGHPVDKVELVIMGGTFPAMEGTERDEFVRGCLDMMNGAPSADLHAAIDANEDAPHRCVALTLETRPDLCDPPGVDSLLAMGATRVEIGVQVTEDAPLRIVGRGHGVAESVSATRNLKDAGLKVGYHLMLGLPGMSPEEDLRALERVIDDPSFRPDLLKLYPTLVMEGTELHRWWAEGKYTPLDEEGAVGILAAFKARLPPWVRVSRVERDIPSNLIAAGIRASNLRQLVADRMRADGTRCRCIRCREVGRRGPERLEAFGASHEVDPDEVEVVSTVYDASGGREAFLVLELPEHDAIVGYARVRDPSGEAWRHELEGAAVLREIRVLGEALPLGGPPGGGGLSWQHRGLGRRLLEEAELTTVGWGRDRLAVTAGMGTRGYFRTMGYSLAGPYMVRDLE